MAIYTLCNDELTIEVNSFGAELTVIKDKNDVQYLWNGDSEYWGRRSPVLFPIVGNLKNKKYSYKSIEYAMSQHGFARDYEFVCTKQKTSEIWFELVSNSNTKENYPFEFVLEIGYKLDGTRLEVLWKVTNCGEEMLPFSIGGHPAFMCPVNNRGKQTDYRIVTDAKNKLESTIISENGLAERKTYDINLNEGCFPITANMFDNDAIVLENNQVGFLGIAYGDEEPYISIEFDMPACGIWSPAKRNAPFVCLEPWCGRCDAEDFEGDIFDREYGILLKPKQMFEKSFAISVNIL